MEELVSSLGPSERQQLAEGFLGNGAYDEPSNESTFVTICKVSYIRFFKTDQNAVFIFIYIIQKIKGMHIIPQRYIKCTIFCTNLNILFRMHLFFNYEMCRSKETLEG